MGERRVALLKYVSQVSKYSREYIFFLVVSGVIFFEILICYFFPVFFLLLLLNSKKVVKAWYSLAFRKDCVTGLQKSCFLFLMNIQLAWTMGSLVAHNHSGCEWRGLLNDFVLYKTNALNIRTFVGHQVGEFSKYLSLNFLPVW